MKKLPAIRIGHLNIIDHLLLGITHLKSQQDITPVSHFQFIPQPSNSWSQVTEKLREKRLNAAFLPVPMAMDLYASGMDIRVIMLVHRSGSVIVKHQTPGVKTISDFKEKTVLVPSVLSIQNMLIHRLLVSAGLQSGDLNEPADISYETTSPCLMPEMLKADIGGDIAGFSVSEPFGSIAIEQKTADLLCTSHSLWKDHPCCVLVVSQPLIHQYPEAVEALISLFVQTAKQISPITDDICFTMAADFLGVSEIMVKKILAQSNIRFTPELLIPDMDQLNTIQNYMADPMGVLKNTIDINELVDDSFIVNAIQEL